VFKLNRSIYDLPQSERNWYTKFKTSLVEIGFKPLISENCIFVMSQDNIFVAIAVYVDDFTIVYNSRDMCDKIITLLKKTFEIMETTNSNKFLNITIKRFKTGIGLSQIEYIEKLLLKYGMSECNPVTTPIVPGEDKSF